MPEEEMVQKLKGSLGALADSVESPKERRIYINIKRENLLPVIKHLKEQYDGYHISTITSFDLGAELELLYHIFIASKFISVRVKMPKSDPTVPTITSILPGAILYEREISELMGVKVKGHPDMRLLLLPENWGKKGHPLRKDWKDPRKGGEA